MPSSVISDQSQETHQSKGSMYGGLQGLRVSSWPGGLELGGNYANRGSGMYRDTADTFIMFWGAGR